ncbi:MAG: SprB repeat-containing protein, partial [Phaeodactylibacter sp.]|nr:SprB repeat-containing protein [Phaeodactylibacter sp.]
LVVNGTVYNEGNPSGTEIIENGSANGCDSIIQVSLTFLEQIYGNVEGSTAICPGETVQLTLHLQGASSFNVELSDGRTFFNVSDGHTFLVTPLVTATYKITLLTAVGSLCPVEIGPGATVTVSSLSPQINTTNYDGFGVSCAGSADGAVLAMASGGIPPLSFLWNTGATTADLSGIPAGSYTVTITDGVGCSRVASVALTAPEPITVVSSGQAPDCFNETGGRILLDSLAGGVAPFEYSLDGQFFQSLGGLPDTISGLAAGSYNLWIQDVNDCQAQVAVGVPEAQELILELGDDQTIKLG